MHSYSSFLIICQKDFMLDLARRALTKATGSMFSYRLPVVHFCPLMPSVIILRKKWRRFITSVSQSSRILCPEYIHNIINRKTFPDFNITSAGPSVLQYGDVNILAEDFLSGCKRFLHSFYLAIFLFFVFI